MGSSGGGIPAEMSGIPNSGRGVPIAGQGPPGGQFGAARPTGQDPNQMRSQLAMLLMGGGGRGGGGGDPRLNPRAAMGMHRGGADLGMGTPSAFGGPQGMGSALMGGGGGRIPYDPNIDGPQKLLQQR